MQRRFFILVIVLFVLGLMAVTNPSKEEYTTWAQEKALAESDSFLEGALTALFGEKVFDSVTQTSNFVFFTVYTTELPENETFKVIGLLRNFVPLNTSQHDDDTVTTTAEVEINSSPVEPEPQPEPEPVIEQSETIATEESTVKVSGKEGTFELPLIGVEAVYGIGDRKPSLLPKEPMSELHFDIPADQASQLAVYWVNDGDDIRGTSYVAPLGWTVESAGVGANGSTALELKLEDQRVSFYYAGGCFGCTVDSIGEYFPEHYEWALENSVLGSVTTHPDWDIVKIDDHSVAYSYWNDRGVEVHGVAVQIHGEEQQPFFWRAEVENENRELATTVLNCFLSKFRNLS